MDDAAFDRLMKALRAAPSRRHALGLAASALLGGLARLLGLAGTASGKKKGKGRARCAPRGAPRTGH